MWAQCDHKGPSKWKEEVEESEKNVILLDFEVEKVSLEAGKGQKMGPPLELQ